MSTMSQRILAVGLVVGFAHSLLSSPAAARCLPQDAKQAASSSNVNATRGEVFDVIWTTVRDDFFDPDLRGLDWQTIGDTYRPLAIAAKDDIAFAAVINKMLSELKTSHTYYFTRHDPRYHQILGIFHSATFLQDVVSGITSARADGLLAYDGIGIETIEHDGSVFISGVYEGCPGAKAGLKVGDQIVSVNGDGFRPVDTFAGKAGQAMKLRYQREDNGPIVDISITPVALDATEMFLRIMRNSVRVIDQHDLKVGYIHAWSYAGEKYQELLREELMSGRLAECDALVLDLRDGWGGASPDYLNLFNKNIPVLSMKPRGGELRTYPTNWLKPTALLTNGGVTSGKEVFAYGFKQAKRGPIVGTRTAGAVVGGSPRVMPDGSVLYLAVSDAEVDGKRLEGVGVEPTIVVERPLPYSGGADPQLDAAVSALVDEVNQEQTTRSR